MALEITWQDESYRASLIEARDSDPTFYTNFVFSLMVIGVSKVTAENVNETVARLGIVDDILGKTCMEYDGTSAFTVKNVSRFVGLQANVPAWTRKQFITHMADIMSDRLSRDVSHLDKTQTVNA